MNLHSSRAISSRTSNRRETEVNFRLNEFERRRRAKRIETHVVKYDKPLITILAITWSLVAASVAASFLGHPSAVWSFVPFLSICVVAYKLRSNSLSDA